MREIPIGDRRRAIATAALLSSDNDGEALSAARTLRSLLSRHFRSRLPNGGDL